MRYGYWMPVFGGWLRNVEDEGMAPTWEYTKKLAKRSEQIGFDLSLVAELNLNDIKGEEAPVARRLEHGGGTDRGHAKLELMVAVRPTFHNPALLAKQAANIDHIGGGAGCRSTSFPAGGRTRRRSTASISSSTTTATPAPPNGSTW